MKQFIFKSTVFTLIILCGFTPLKAKQFTGKVIVNTPLNYDDGVRDVTYNYMVDNEGNRILNGVFSIKGIHKYTGRVPGLGSLSESGTYRLSANYKNDELNGPMNVSANYTETANSWGRVESNNYKYSLTGSFVNGLPNGAFNVTSRNGGMPSYAKVNFKKGVLVGAFSCDTYYDHGFSYKYTGTLTADGQLTGTWTVNTNGNYEKETYSFLNGVLLSYSSKKEDTSPKETELARKYATNAITQEELLTMGYAVVDDCLELGKYVKTVILSGAIAPWGEKNGIFGYDFSTDNNKHFKSLKKLKIADKELVDNVANLLLSDIDNPKSDYTRSRLSVRETYGKYGIFEEEYGMYYMESSYRYDEKTYFTKKQMEIIDNAIEAEKQRRLKQLQEEIKKSESKLQYVLNVISKASNELKKSPEKYAKDYYGISDLFEPLFNHHGGPYVDVTTSQKLSEILFRNYFPYFQIEIDTLSKEQIKGQHIGDCVVKYLCTATLYHNFLKGENCGILKFKFNAYWDLSEGLKVEKTFNREDFVCIYDDKEELAKLQDSTLHNKNKIFELTQTIAKDVTDSYKRVESNYEYCYKRKVLEVGKAVEALRELNSIQSQCINFIGDRQIVEDKDNIVISKAKQFDDIAKSYKNYMLIRDLTWSPEESNEKLKSVMAVQDECVEFIGIRQIIADYDTQILTNGAAYKDVLKAYKNYMKSADLSWSPNESKDKLKVVTNMQEVCLNFIKERQHVAENESQILSQGAKYKELLKAYKKYIQTVDLGWRVGETADKFKDVQAIQNAYLSAILSPTAMEKEKEIKALKDKSIESVLNVIND